MRVSYWSLLLSLRTKRDAEFIWRQISIGLQILNTSHVDEQLYKFLHHNIALLFSDIISPIRRLFRLDSVASVFLSLSPHAKIILYNKALLLHMYLPDRSQIVYTLRNRNHNKILIPKTSDLNERHFLIRVLYKHCY